jgi:amino acid permease
VLYNYRRFASLIPQITVVEFPEYFRGLKDTPQYEIEWVGHHFDIRWFQGWATMMLAYYSQVLFFYVRGEMMNKTEKRIEKLIWIMTAFSVVLFALFSCLGYLSLGDKIVPSLFTLRRKLGSSWIT